MTRPTHAMPYSILIHDIRLLVACTDVFDEDVLNRKGFTSARNIDAMELSQMLEFRDEAPGDYRRHCLVVIIYLKHKSGISGDEPKSLST